MATSKAFIFIIISISLVFFLGGCASKPPKTGSHIADSPVSESQNLKREQKPQTAPSLQTEQNINSTPPQDTLTQPVFSSEEPIQITHVPISYADLEFIQQRLNEYQLKLDQWLKISKVDEESKLAGELSSRGIECAQLLERILTGYSTLLKEMQHNQTVPVDKIDTVDPKSMQQLDIAFLESRCGEILAMDTSPQDESATGEELQYSFDESQEIITTHVENENFNEALIGYSNLLANYPDQKPAIYTQLNYGLALQYTGQVEAAARHFSKILASDDLSVEPLSLQLEVADLLLASGKITAAESYYENFILARKSIEAEKSWAEDQLAFLRSVEPASEDMLAYTKLLRDFLTYDYRVHSVELNEKLNMFAMEYAGSPVAVGALRLKEFTIKQLNSWFGRQLVKIDFLVAEKNFTEATEILNHMTQYYLPADLQAIVQRTYYEVSQAELMETENQLRMQEMELTEEWDTAIHLMDSQHFEEAILAFEVLMGTEYEEKATIKIVEAANLAAGQLRKEAASLFIQAGRTPNIEKKKELLLNSHRMLNEIVVKFPQTDLIEKVNQNIAILEEQIRKIDPDLLVKLQEENHSVKPE